MYRASGLFAFLLASVIACNGSDLTLPGTPGPPALITVVTGDGQEALVGTPLPDPLVVKVTDAEGNAVPAQQVVFALAEETPGAVLTPDATSTASDGTAEARWVLGQVGGTQQVAARVMSGEAPGALEVRFTASALLLPRGADRLALPSEPSARATAGVKLERQPVIQIQDPDGNDISRAGVAITAAVASGEGNLSGAATQLTDDAGRAAFTNLTIAAAGAHVLIFAADGYASVTSGMIDVEAAPPNRGGGGNNEGGQGGGGGRDDDDDQGQGGGGGHSDDDDDDAGNGGGGGGEGDDDDEDDDRDGGGDDDERDDDGGEGGGGKGGKGKGGKGRG